VRRALILALAACSSEGADVGDDIAAVPANCASERSLADRPDDLDHDQIRVLYVTPSDGVDLERDTNGQICNSVRGFASWFHDRAGDPYLRFDTFGGEVDIGFVRLGRTDAEMKGTDPGNQTYETGIAFVRERIESELAAAGMIAPNKVYAVYYEGSSAWACGAGAWPPLITARVGAMYLNGIPFGTSIKCSDQVWGQASLAPGYQDYAMLHEIVHTVGFVPDAAPHEHQTGHVFESNVPTTSRDLMYSPRDGMPDPPWGIFADGGLLLDVNNDDYFRTASGLDLETSSILAPLVADAIRPIGW
jgi:hypothetical protein